MNEWEKSGKRSFEQRLQEITLKTMEHRPEPLPKKVVRTLDDMQSGWR
ncbi:MAG: hypothetical protein P8Y38_00170 [Deltaproteobacteria bacterium]